MDRRTSRLVALVMLLAFLFANGLAASHARWADPGCTCTNALPSDCPAAVAHASAGSGCQHSGARSEPAHTETATADPMEPGYALHLPCPCHDSDSFPCPACPCPGGCAYCSVAKVPCFLSSPLLTDRDPCPGERITDAPPDCLSPYPREITRPPRLESLL